MIKVRFIGWGIFKDENNKEYVYEDEGILISEDGKKYKIVEKLSNKDFILRGE